MSGLFKAPAQESVFTLGDEDVEYVDPETNSSSVRGVDEAAIAQSSSQRNSQATPLPVSSVAEATQGPLKGSNGTAPAVRHDTSSAKGVDTRWRAQDSEIPSDISSSGPDVTSSAINQSAHGQKKQSEHLHPTSATAEGAASRHAPQTSEKGHPVSSVQNGSARPVEGAIPDQSVAAAEIRHLDEDEAEEQRIAEELAALEVEAEEQALQEQQARSAPHLQQASTHARGSDVIPLSDGISSAERAMAEAEQAAQQATAGTTAMQTALDGFEPRKRPFSPPPGSAPLQRFSPTAEYVEAPEFQGLLFFDGLDSLGRPVVIVNADAMGENRTARKGAFQYIVSVLEPIVTQGPYVLLLVSLGGGAKSNTVQTGLLVSAYRGLSRPFRKNVKFIILVRPSKPLKALLSFLRPFVSRKAHRKVLKIESLSTVAYATNNEVTLASLGPRFTAAAGDFLH